MLVNGQHYHLTAAISGEKPVLLMLHGFTGTSETFQDSISGLKERFNIIAPDLLGHGNTASPEEISSYTMENICEDLAGILHQLN
ncbi:alpha/beta fold hydrolase, partial [Listeria monocytogenes]